MSHRSTIITGAAATSAPSYDANPCAVKLTMPVVHHPVSKTVSRLRRVLLTCDDDELCRNDTPRPALPDAAATLHHSHSAAASLSTVPDFDAPMRPQRRQRVLLQGLSPKGCVPALSGVPSATDPLSRAPIVSPRDGKRGSDHGD